MTPIDIHDVERVHQAFDAPYVAATIGAKYIEVIEGGDGYHIDHTYSVTCDAFNHESDWLRPTIQNGLEQLFGGMVELMETRLARSDSTDKNTAIIESTIWMLKDLIEDGIERNYDELGFDEEPTVDVSWDGVLIYLISECKKGGYRELLTELRSWFDDEYINLPATVDVSTLEHIALAGGTDEFYAKTFKRGDKQIVAVYSTQSTNGLISSIEFYLCLVAYPDGYIKVVNRHSGGVLTGKDDDDATLSAVVAYTKGKMKWT